jgi:hypothetical protein
VNSTLRWPFRGLLRGIGPERGRPTVAMPTSTERSRLSRHSLLAAVPGLAFVAIDLAVRRPLRQITSPGDGLRYGAELALSLVVWGLTAHLVASLASARRRVIFGALYAVAFGSCVSGQLYAWEQYGAFVTAQQAHLAVLYPDSVKNGLGVGLRRLGVLFAVAAAGAGTLLSVMARAAQGARAFDVRWAAATAGSVALAVALPTPTSPPLAPPDRLWLRSLAEAVSLRVRGVPPELQTTTARVPAHVPALRTTPGGQRNVVLVVLESLRFDAVCLDDDRDCLRTQATHREIPDRIAFRELHALDSTTAISLAVLWTGLEPTEPADVLRSAPSVFDYAKAAGYSTGIWTSQNLAFGTSRAWFDSMKAGTLVEGRDLEEDPHIDLGAHEDRLVTRAIDDLTQLREPFFAVLQFSSTHWPYRVEPEGPQPHQPAQNDTSPEQKESYRRYYLNSVHQQDHHLARFLRELKARRFGGRTVVLATSDHGESFREHGPMGHTFSLFEEETHVPGWVWAAEGALSPEERATLAQHAARHSYHVDVLPTVLDLARIETPPGRSRLAGQSWLRAPAPRGVLGMSNCSALWSCGFENWGVTREGVKVFARSGDDDYACWDSVTDPAETTPSTREPACGELLAEARRRFPRLPGRP